MSDVSNITFESFDEWALKWGRRIRGLRPGEAFAMLQGEPGVREVLVDYDPIEESPWLAEAVAELLERNHARDFFVTGAEADREIEECRRSLLSGPVIRLASQSDDEAASESVDPFS